MFGEARTRGLTPEDLALFAESENFERVLSDLSTTIRVDEALGIAAARVYERYRSVQAALGHAIRHVHVPRGQVPDSTLRRIRRTLAEYTWIFTTSYDLLLYWALGCGGRFEPFVDLFRGRARLDFDARRADVRSGQIPVYFLHGALHLVVGGSGNTWKLRGDAFRTLLDQFGEPIPDDPHARPLLVTEGTARDKLRAIEGNAYLANALERLRAVDVPIAVFGSSLSAQDDHLVAALTEQPRRPVAISLLPGSRRDLAVRQADIYGRLRVDELYFFDARTHPFGYPDLRVP